MTLWEVDDFSTQQFMSLFYSYWLEEKMPKRDALKEAQLELKKSYPSPYHWGAFVLIGN